MPLTLGMTGSIELRFGSSRSFFSSDVLSAILAISAIHLRFTSSLFCENRVVTARGLRPPRSVSQFAFCHHSLGDASLGCTTHGLILPYLSYLILVPCAVSSTWYIFLQVSSRSTAVLSRTMKSALVDWSRVTRQGERSCVGVAPAARVRGEFWQQLDGIHLSNSRHTRHLYNQ